MVPRPKHELEHDKLTRWHPSEDAAWQARLAADHAAAEHLQTPEMRRITTVVVERALAGGAAAVALTGSTARASRTAISDLDYHVVGARPPARDLPANVDIYAGDERQLMDKLHAGDDVVQWTLRWGCILVDDGVLRRAAVAVAQGGLWPDGAAKLARPPQRRRAVERLLEIGDRDAAHDEVRATLTSAARGVLLSARIFPLSRSELPGQLTVLGRHELADALELAIHGRPSVEELHSSLLLFDRVFAGRCRRGRARRPLRRLHIERSGGRVDPPGAEELAGLSTHA